MLILSRRVTESIMIGDRLRLRVIAITRSAVLIQTEDAAGRVTGLVKLYREEGRNPLRQIAPDVFLALREIRGYTCRLGIEAPKTVSVHRQEIYDRIQAERPARPVGLPDWVSA